MELEIGINSYMNLDEANSIVSNEYLSDEEEYKIWSDLSDDDKIKLIVRGTRQIDKLPFIGIKLVNWNLSWPRYIYNKEVDTPQEIKIAVLKNVLQEKKYSSTKEQQFLDLNVTSYKIKDASITFGSNGNSANSKVNGIYVNIFNAYLTKWIY